ncbi:hypothetical protein LTR37_001211 [Vermiconidia calcicola]|uniref:Uncharacterized protein n=1 Tax=Vermiconidia calcicola TaxID=1690605 RepID=A0ACC3NXT5_9PEZI|nr:hypothetical protein LTR37_001211 [Vermiconidia calcicola]
MAPYIQPKSIRLADKRPEKLAMDSLAHETLLQIVKDVPTKDILSLRLTCRHVAPVCSTILQERAKTLYIHPSDASLKHALEICAHPIFSRYIEEVILLGKPTWREVEKAYPGMRSGADEDCYYQSLPEYFSRYKPWPLWYSDQKGDEKIKADPYLYDLATLDPTELSSIGLFIDDTYINLLDALAKLPHLHKLGFADHVAESRRGISFNQTRQATIDAHAHKWAEPPCERSTSYIRKKQTSTYLPARRSNVEVFYGLLFSKRLHFTSFSQGTELPFVRDQMNYVEHKTKNRPQPYLASISSFTNLELYVDCGWGDNDQYLFYTKLMQHSSSTLQSLRLTFGANARVEKAVMEDVLAAMLPQQPLENLQRLEIEVLPASYEVSSPKLSKRKRVTSANRQQRPNCQWLQDMQTLRRHAKNLTRLRLKNIVFDTLDRAVLPSRYNVPETTRRVIRMLEETATELEHVEWIVPRFEHHPRCKRADEEHMMECRKYQCGLYNNTGNVPSTTEGLDMLAVELGVELDLQTSTFDFGKPVMRFLEANRRSGSR